MYKPKAPKRGRKVDPVWKFHLSASTSFLPSFLPSFHQSHLLQTSFLPTFRYSRALFPPSNLLCRLPRPLPIGPTFLFRRWSSMCDPCHVRPHGFFTWNMWQRRNQEFRLSHWDSRTRLSFARSKYHWPFGNNSALTHSHSLPIFIRIQRSFFYASQIEQPKYTFDPLVHHFHFPYARTKRQSEIWFVIK